MVTETPYVLLIHGTWSSSPGWHEFDEASTRNFCASLQHELALRGIADAVWRSTIKGPSTFRWSGANTHEARVLAGAELAVKFREITEADPTARISVVSHSHGCNVTLSAVQNYLQGLRTEAEAVVRRAMLEDPRLVTRRLSSHDRVSEAVDHVFGNEAQAVKKKFAPILGQLGASIEEARARRGTRFLESRNFRVRPRFDFVGAWLNSERNRIGRLVFLGPPFLRKVWKPRSLFTEYVVRTLDFLSGLVLGTIFTYVLCLTYWTAVWLLTTGFWLFNVDLLQSPSWNPLDWPTWLLVLACTVALFFSVSLGVGIALASRRTNRNLYFDKIFSVRPGQLLPIETLTATAEMLDEVLLGFSLEPVIFGALLPQLRDLFRPRISLRLPPPPIGYVGGVSETLMRWVSFGAGVGSAVLRRLLFPVTRFLERQWIGRLLRIATSAAYGIQLQELHRASVVASSKIDEPKFFKEHIWDVSRLLVADEPQRGSADGRESKYAFLWDRDKFLAMRDSSFLWDRTMRFQKEIEEHYKSSASALVHPESGSLSRACIVLEERFKEAIGVTGLAHSAYYSNETILRAVADFIKAGRTPAHGVSQVAGDAV